MEHIKENVQSIPIPGLEQDEPPLVQQPQSSRNDNQQHHNNQQQEQQHHQNGFVADFMNARVAATGGNGNGTSSNGDIPSSGSMNMFGSYGTTSSNTDQPVDDNQNDFFDEMVNTGQDDDGGSVSEFLNSDMDFEQAATTENKPSELTQQQPNVSEDTTMAEIANPSLSTISSMEQGTPAVSSSSAPTQQTTANSAPSISAPLLSGAQQPLAQVQTQPTQPVSQETQQFQVQAQVPTEQITSQTAPTQAPSQTVPDAPALSFTGQTNEENPDA